MHGRFLFILFTIFLASCFTGLNAESFDIRASASTCDMTELYERTEYQAYNYGLADILTMGDNYQLTRNHHLLINPLDLGDSMQVYGADSWDSLHIILTCTSAGFFVSGDTLYFKVHKILTAWTEGVGLGASDTCGACWDSANATGYTGCAGDPAAWTSEGAESDGNDRAAAYEFTDSLYLLGAEVDGDSTITIRVSGATLTDTLGDYGVGVYMSTQYPSTCDARFNIASDDNTAEADRPLFRVFYTPGSEVVKWYHWEG
jgi:hypothetical protein